MVLLLKMEVGLSLLVETRRFVAVRVMSMGNQGPLLVYTSLRFKD
jgi:hypothetical protein